MKSTTPMFLALFIATSACSAQGFGNTAVPAEQPPGSGAFGNTNPAWTKRYAQGNAYFEVKSMAVDPKSGDIVAIGEQELDAITGLLTTDGSRMSQIHLRRFDRGGGQMWDVPHIGSANQPNRAKHVLLLADGTPLIIGSYGSPRKAQHFLVKAGHDGKEQQKRSLGQPGWDLLEVHATPDGGFLLSGGLRVPGPKFVRVATIFKIDGNGNFVGEARFDDLSGQVVAVRADGSFFLFGQAIVGGERAQDHVLALLDAQGNEQWRRSIQLPRESDDVVSLHRFHLHGDGGMLALGSAVHLSRGESRRKARLVVARFAADGTLEDVELRPTAFENLSVAALAPGRSETDVVAGLYGQPVFGDRGDGVLVRLDARTGAELGRQELPQLLINSMLRHPDGTLLVAGREITSFSIDRRGRYHESANGVIAKLDGP